MKVDGPTKEEFVWGFRTGMLTFAAPGLLQRRDALYQALEKKAAGAIRSAISNCSHVSPVGAGQVAGRPTSLPAERQQKKEILAGPGQAGPRDPCVARVRRPLGALSLQLRLLHVPEAQGLDAETYRKHLLENYGVGVIADGDRDIRIAFSAVDLGQLDDLYASSPPPPAISAGNDSRRVKQLRKLGGTP